MHSILINSLIYVSWESFVGSRLVDVTSITWAMGYKLNKDFSCKFSSSYFTFFIFVCLVYSVNNQFSEIGIPPRAVVPKLNCSETHF